MSETLQVGDRVRVVPNMDANEWGYHIGGALGTLLEVDDDDEELPYLVHMDDEGLNESEGIWFYAADIERVQEVPVYECVVCGERTTAGACPQHPDRPQRCVGTAVFPPLTYPEGFDGNEQHT